MDLSYQQMWDFVMNVVKKNIVIDVTIKLTNTKKSKLI